MPRKVIFFLVAMLAASFGWAQSSSAADLGVYSGGYRGAPAYVGTGHCLGFCGEPFPFRYQWSVARACTRYEPVETPRGVRMEKVWVCGDRSHYYR